MLFRSLAALEFQRIRGGAGGLAAAWKEKMGISDSEDSAAYANFPKLPAWKEEELVKYFQQGHDIEDEDISVCPEQPVYAGLLEAATCASIRKFLMRT